MARNRELPYDGDNVTIIPADDAMQYDPDLENAFTEFRDALKTSQATGMLRVYRIPYDERGRPSYVSKNQAILFSCPVDLYSMEEIVTKVKKEFIRPGENRICVRLIGTRSGEGGIKFNKILEIEQENQSVPSPNPEIRESMADLLRAVQENSSQQMQAFQGLFERLIASKTPSTDPMQIAIGMMGAMAQFMAVINKPAGAVAAPAGTLLEQIETLKALRGLATDLTGEGGSDENTAVGVAKAVAPVAASFLDILKRSSPQAQLPPPALPRPPSAAPMVDRPPVPQASPSAESRPVVLPGDAPTPPRINPNQPRGDQIVFAQIRPQLDALTQMAAEGADPKTVSEMVLQMMPESDEMDTALFEFLNDSKWFEKLSVMNPKIIPQREWFEKLHAAMLAEFSEEGNPTTGAE